MNDNRKQVVKLAAKLTKSGRIAAVRSGGYCRSYHFGGEAWNQAMHKARAMVYGAEVVSARGYAGYVEGFRPDGSFFCSGGLGPL